MIYSREDLLKFLDYNNIKFNEYSHKPLYTVEDSKKMRGKIDGAHTKNLFLKDKKGNFFLLTCIENKNIDLKKIKIFFNVKNLSFGSEIYLDQLLKLKPGAVSPMGLINDTKKEIKFYLDNDILKEKTVNFHPLVNIFTLNLKVEDFLNFLKLINVRLHLIDLKVYKLT